MCHYNGGYPSVQVIIPLEITKGIIKMLFKRSKSLFAEFKFKEKYLHTFENKDDLNRMHCLKKLRYCWRGKCIN